MWKKIRNLFNVKAWIENVIYKKVVGKGVKGAVSAVLGLFGSALFISKVKPVLDSLGIQIDQVQLTAGLTVFFTGAAAALMNWVKHVMSKE